MIATCRICDDAGHETQGHRLAAAMLWFRQTPLAPAVRAAVVQAYLVSECGMTETEAREFLAEVEEEER